MSHVFGLVHYTVQMGGMTRESFTKFLAATANHLDENENLIFDGALSTARATKRKHIYFYTATVLANYQYCIAGDKLTEVSVKVAMQERFADRNRTRTAHPLLGEYKK